MDMVNNILDEYLESNKEINAAIELTEMEIRKQTEHLQKRLSQLNTDLASNNRKFQENFYTKIVLDKNINILLKLNIWLNFIDHNDSEWIIPKGALRNNFYDLDRYREYSIVDDLREYFADVIADYLEGNEYELYDTYTQIFNTEVLDRICKKMNEEDYKKYESYINNAIEMNIDIFTCDW